MMLLSATHLANMWPLPRVVAVVPDEVVLPCVEAIAAAPVATERADAQLSVQVALGGVRE